MPIPPKLRARFQPFLDGVAEAEGLPVDAVTERVGSWPGAVAYFVLLRWEQEGHTGFSDACRLIDMLANLDCVLQSINWLAEQSHAGVKGKRPDGTEFDLILSAEALALDRDSLARILKHKLAIDRQTREVSRVSLGVPPVERRERRRLPSTELYRRADSSNRAEPGNDGGGSSPK